MMKAVTLTKPGPATNLVISLDVPRPAQQNPDELLVRVVASALNRADTLQRQGGYPIPPGASEIIGLEVSGVVEVEAQSKESPFKKGDRVMALLSGGGYAEYAAVPYLHCLRIPDNLSFEQGAAIPEVWLTAYQLLNFVANLKSKQTVLVHAGASGVGTAAIQLAKAAGATPIASVGSDDKVDSLKKEFGIEALNYKKLVEQGDEDPFVKRVMELTNGQGVNIVLDPVGASNFKRNSQLIAREGQWVLFGLMGGGQLPDKADLSVLLRKMVRIEGTTLRPRSKDYKARLVKEFGEHALSKFESGEFKPVIEKVLSFDQIVEAHLLMESNTTLGKIVVKW